MSKKKFQYLKLSFLASLSLHLILLIFVLRLPNLNKNLPDDAKRSNSSPVKIKLENKLKILEERNLLTNKKPRVKNARKKINTKRIAPTYVDFLPIVRPFGTTESITHVPNRIAHTFEDSDVENASLSDSVKFGDMSKLQIFAQELSQRIFLPTALTKLQEHGSAQLRFSRELENRWKVKEFDGDPYTRSLLFDLLENLSEKDFALFKLNASKFNSIRITFEYTTVSVSNESAKELEVAIDGNKILIKKTRKESSINWNMLMASPGALPAINLIGVGMVLAKPWTEKDWHSDAEIKRLELSPAFMKREFK